MYWQFATVDFTLKKKTQLILCIFFIPQLQLFIYPCSQRFLISEFDQSVISYLDQIKLAVKDKYWTFLLVCLSFYCSIQVGLKGNLPACTGGDRFMHVILCVF